MIPFNPSDRWIRPHITLQIDIGALEQIIRIEWCTQIENNNRCICKRYRSNSFRSVFPVGQALKWSKCLSVSTYASHWAPESPSGRVRCFRCPAPSWLWCRPRATAATLCPSWGQSSKPLDVHCPPAPEWALAPIWLYCHRRQSAIIVKYNCERNELRFKFCAFNLRIARLLSIFDQPWTKWCSVADEHRWPCRLRVCGCQRQRHDWDLAAVDSGAVLRE